LVERTNKEWVADLTTTTAEREHALGDLRAHLERGLGYALAKYRGVSAADIEDFVQDAMLKVLDNIHSFRGESRFTTWAQKIAIHVAFTELRRRRWRDVSLEQVTTLPDGEELPKKWVDPSASTEQQAMQNEILQALYHVITTELTEKQRQAFVAVRLHGTTVDQVAELMGTNRNALYKLLFDAKQKLKRHLMQRGVTVQDVISAFES
jgi:RNA polymerase sigma-70 factor (ECF subfamily)